MKEYDILTSSCMPLFSEDEFLEIVLSENANLDKVCQQIIYIIPFEYILQSFSSIYISRYLFYTSTYILPFIIT